MEKNKEVVKPIDESEFLTDEPKEELEQIKQIKKWSEYSLFEQISGIVLLVWFFGSIIAMIFLAEINEKLTIILFGQLFFGFGLIALFSKDQNGKRFNPIALPFVIVGFLCIAIPLCIMFPELLPVSLNWDNIIPFIMLAGFILVGFVVSLILIRQKERVFMILIFGGFFIVLPGIGLSIFMSQEPQFINTEETQEQIENNDDEPSYYDDVETTYKEYKVGEKVTAKLNNVLEQEFYVLKNSTKDDSTVLLFATKNIGYSAFNNNYTDGNEFEGSLIQTTLNDLTKNWTNVKEKRLIKVEEIVETGLIHEERESRCHDGNCEAVYTYVNQDSFFYNENEFYWTMTKVNDKETTGDTNRYVYLIDLSGCVETHIVGYTPGGEWNKEGNFFQNFGIRPVIEIDKEYIK